MHGGWAGEVGISSACACLGDTPPCPLPAARACWSLRKWAVIKNRQHCNGLGNKHFKAHTELFAAPLWAHSSPSLYFPLGSLPTANLTNYTSWSWMWSTFWCEKEVYVCVCVCMSLTLNRPCLWLCWPSHTPLPVVISIWGGSITRS